MITCERAKELLSDFLENELAPDLKRLMDEHLKTCPNCWELGVQVKFITDKLHVINSIHTSEQFDQQLRNRIINDPKIKQKNIPLSFQKLSYGFSGIAVLAAIYFFVFADNNPTAPNSPARQESQSSGNINMQSPQNGQNPTLINQQAGNAVSQEGTDTLDNQKSNIDQDRIRLIDQD